MTKPHAQSGLTGHCALLALDRNLVVFLHRQVAPGWVKDHPPSRRRVRVPLWRLLIATLLLLRDGTTFSRAAAAVGISTGRLHQGFHDLLPRLAAIGIAQADGTLLTSEALPGWLAEMRASGELALVDGTDTGCPRPSTWAAQKPFYDAKHHRHATNIQVLTTRHGDLLAVHGGWPGAVPEPEQLTHAWFAPALALSGVRVVADRGYRRRALADKLPILTARGNHRTPQPGDRQLSVERCEVERPIGLLKAWAMVRRSRVRWRAHHLIAGAVAVLVGLRTYGPRVAGWPAGRKE